jgi:hypothetical protein
MRVRLRVAKQAERGFAKLMALLDSRLRLPVAA